jgi:hypothetical protein
MVRLRAAHIDVAGRRTVVQEPGSPIISSWRDGHFDAGWFGYAPLTSTSPGVAQSCKSPARHRLELAGALLAGTALILLRPRRWFGRASGAQPSLAA